MSQSLCGSHVGLPGDVWRSAAAEEREGKLDLSGLSSFPVTLSDHTDFWGVSGEH